MVMGLTFGAGVALALAAPLLIPAILGPEYAQAIPLVWLLAIGAMPMASYHLDVATLNGLGQLGASSRAATVGAAILVLVSLALIPSLGVWGAALASIAAYTGMAASSSLSLARISHEAAVFLH